MSNAEFLIVYLVLTAIVGGVFLYVTLGSWHPPRDPLDRQ